jgi:carbamoyl-phosphate synthase large subunit
VIVLLAVGSLLIVLGAGWRVVVTRRVRRRLLSLLGSADPATRAGALAILVAEGIERFAPALLRMSDTEKDPAVLKALAEVVSRTQAMPARTPDLITLRLWAATHQGAIAAPARLASIPAEGVVITNGTVIAGGQGRHRLPAPARQHASLPPGTSPSSGMFVPAASNWPGPSAAAVAAINGESPANGGSTGYPMAAATTAVGRSPATAAEKAGMAAASQDLADYGARNARMVLVTGAGGSAGVAVIRALRRAGHRVLACDADSYAVGFRLADEFARVPRADDSAFAESLAKAVVRSGAVALISTVAEELVPLHAVAASLAEAGAATWLPDPWSVEHCVDKWLFHQLMTEHGVPVPATALRSEHGVPGPWIVKPRFGRGSRDIYDAANAADLAYALSRAPEPLVQTKITGREFTVDTLSGQDGRLHGAVPRWRLETKAGISTKGVTFRHHELVDLVANVLGALRLEGPACVQGFRTDDGKIVFTEVNPRFSGGLPLSLAAGADLVGQYLSRILGGVVQPERLSFRSGVTMMRYLDEVFEE